MGLISKTVKITWQRKTCSYYKKLGYTFTKINDEFEIKVEDLMDSSGTLVDARCNHCGKVLKNIKWVDYKKCVHEDGTYYCNACAKLLFSRKSKIKTLLKNGDKSFYDWCLENNRFDILLRWDYELNKCSPSDITYGTGKQYYFKCPRGIHPSELKNISSFTNHYKKYGNSNVLDCKVCNSIGQYICDTYGNDKLNYYWDWDKNVDKNGNPLNPFEISKYSNKTIYIYCQIHSYHGSYPIICSHFTNGSRCSYCVGRKVHVFDSIGWYIMNKYSREFLDKIWVKKNKKSPFEYSLHSGKSVYWKCLHEKHDDYLKKISESLICDFRCPECMKKRNESMLQEKVRLYLESLNIGQVLHEYKCTIKCINPKTKYQLPYDNEIIINNKHLIIEVMGKQHYILSMWNILNAEINNTTPEYELHKLQLYDRYKRMYAKFKGYEYLEISYKNIQDNKKYKTIINNKLNKVLKGGETINE